MYTLKLPAHEAFLGRLVGREEARVPSVRDDSDLSWLNPRAIHTATRVLAHTHDGSRAAIRISPRHVGDPACRAELQTVSYGHATATATANARCENGQANRPTARRHDDVRIEMIRETRCCLYPCADLVHVGSL